MSRLRSQTDLLTVGNGAIVTSTTAPAGVPVGTKWFNPTTAVTYQRTANVDGTLFWLDITSSGIGTSATRGVDFVGDIDPHKATNGSGLAVGSVYYNREKNKHFVCTEASSGANVWAGRFAGAGGQETTYKSGSDFYKIHTFLGSETLDTHTHTHCTLHPWKLQCWQRSQ